ncbi:RNA polymerase recycling motor ATPase HelR [Gordonia sp. i37]|uniref:RNA polymerase recycling motor ATPase HelR n=1 Tax=Gordonia sp. i37 TaxID=1961707 RepID=UPI0025B79682|nr:RNA polymerase recycling motor ATPase HelR [Gordonia sp. i37]
MAPMVFRASCDPAVIGDDDRHFAVIPDHLTHTIADLNERLGALRLADGGGGRRALDRDLEIHETNRRLRVLRRYSLDLCLGRIVRADGTISYIGRIGMTDRGGEQLLVDWRTPAAAPFFAATHADPQGLSSRRRYRWSQGQVVDFWDESFDGEVAHLALDDDSAFLAGLGASREPRMRDVLGTIAADQDAIIRADSHGALVVDGGPGTGKTVVALHRAAYLLYADPRLAGNRGELLVVGPHEEYLGYISDVLPSLGEDGVRTCTLHDLVPEGGGATTESDSVVALKDGLDPIAMIERAVAFYEQPPTNTVEVETPWGETELTAPEWAEAFSTPEPGTSHHEAREQVWDALTDIIADALDTRDLPRLRRALAGNDDLVSAFTTAWPILDAPTLVGDLWSVPAYLRLAAPELNTTALRTLQRDNPTAWTTSDIPFLDAARRRLGDPGFSRRRRRREAVLAAGRDAMDRVVDDLLAAHTFDDGEGLAPMLRGEDLRSSLVDDSTAPVAERDPLAGPFAHIIVDEAQELTDAQWSMLVARCPSRSVTVVGDRAQSRRGFTESWPERLRRVGFGEVRVAGLSINYRTPEEIMAQAAPVITTAIPDANVPTSIRSSAMEVGHGTVADLAAILDEWERTHPEGVACVIGDPSSLPAPIHRPRVRTLAPERVKGLEFDLVVLVAPDRFGAGITGAVDRYVAMTRATQQLVILS